MTDCALPAILGHPYDGGGRSGLRTAVRGTSLANDTPPGRPAAAHTQEGR